MITAVVGLPRDCTARPATPDDAEAVVALINAAEVTDLGEVVVEVEDVRAEWASSDVDLPTDTLLVERDGHLVAWAQVEGVAAQADVHPAHRGQGIGTALAGWIEARTATRLMGAAERRTGQTLGTAEGGGRGLLRSRGYVETYEAWILRLPAAAPLPVVRLPEGLTIRPATGPGDEVGAYHVIETAFSAWPGRQDRTYEQWRSYAVDHDAFEPGLLFVAAEDDGTIVGACMALRYPSEGWVQQIAVDAAHRGRGLGAALLGTAFGELRNRGETRMGLSTDSRTGALDLYLHIGMQVETAFVHLDKTLA